MTIHLNHRIPNSKDKLILEERNVIESGKELRKFFTAYLSYEIIEDSFSSLSGKTEWGYQSNNSTMHDTYQDALATFIRRRDAKDNGFAP